MLAKLVKVEIIAKNIKSLWFAPENFLEYTAGQFIEMTLNHQNADNRGQKRWFTLSSSPSEKLICITTKQSENRMSSFKHTLFSLKKGDTVKITEPMGDFVLPKDVNIPLVFVAGGIGITPMRSMVKWLIDTAEKRKIQLFYSAENIDEIAFKELFELYGVHFSIILPTKEDQNQFRANQIFSKIEQCLSQKTREQLIYVSGPEPFTELLEKKLMDIGVTSENLVLDFFPGYQLD